MEEGGDELEEERRLCYVGITRAEKRIYLLHTARRTIYGASSQSTPSRFLDDLPDHLVERKGLPAGEDSCAGRWEKRPAHADSDDSGISVAELLARKKQAQEPLDLPSLVAGDRVRHTKFGEGQVIGVKPSGPDKEVIVAFEAAGVKKLLQSIARLEKVQVPGSI
jgi:DNA helicase II / ATP-dependent DNA helicase PcrA